MTGCLRMGVTEMAAKSRGNFPVNWCPMTDCRNRDKKCGVCVKIRKAWTHYARGVPGVKPK